jgi:hypothetical protein
MAVTIAPSTEAMSALVQRINSGEAYELPCVATYSEEIIDGMEDIEGLRVDVVSESETQLSETCDIEDRTSHLIRIWVRRKMDTMTPDQSQTDRTKLLTRQIFQRVNQWDSADQRVKVWECEMGQKEVPDKTMLRTRRTFVASILLRVEVEAS